MADQNTKQSSPYKMVTKEEYMGAKPSPYKKSTSQQIREALLALSGITGSATNIMATGYGRQAPFQQPFSSYEQAVRESGLAQQQALEEEKDWQKRGAEWEKWAPSEAREQARFKEWAGESGQRKLEKQLDLARTAQSIQQTGIEGQRKLEAEAEKKQREEASPFFAEKKRLEGIIASPKSKAKDVTEAQRQLQMLEKGQRVAEPKAWFGLKGEKVEPIATPRPKRDIVSELQVGYGMQPPPSPQATPTPPPGQSQLPPPASLPASAQQGLLTTPPEVTQKAAAETAVYQLADGRTVSIPVAKIPEAESKGWKRIK